MASRNIASMHLFLEMKTKFPHLPEDTLRNYVLLYAQDQAKCISMLQKECENYFHPGQHFIDYHLTENKVNRKGNANIKENSNLMLDSTSFQSSKNRLSNNSDVLNDNFSAYGDSNFTSDTTVKQSRVFLQPFKSIPLPDPSKAASLSAPVIKDSERPFTSIFQSVPDSSQIYKQKCSDQNYDNRMMFSTTKEHIIQPSSSPGGSKFSKEYTVPHSVNTPKQRHAVKLSITPALPFQQQQLNVYSNAVSANASHSSRPGRHTTSVNFQLQPQSSNQLPIEISSVPTATGKPCYRDFSSHVQISVGPQGTSFTALRLQHPSTNVKQTDNNDKLPSDIAYKSSSQGLNSNVMDNKSKSFIREMKVDAISQPKYLNHSDFDSSEHKLPLCDLQTEQYNKNTKTSSDSNPNLQISPDYIEAVKRQQHIHLNIVQEELKKATAICSNLKSEIKRIEHELSKRKEKKKSPYVEDIAKLKEENRQLRVECNCLLMEYEMHFKMHPLDVDNDVYSTITKDSNDLHSNLTQNPKEKEFLEDFQILGDEEKEDDEKNLWKCKKCTFLNHPALDKCEICEISKNSGSFFDDI